MGKKSRRNNTNKKEPIRKGQSAAAVRTRVSNTVLRLFNANKHDEILEIESNYGHLDPFCNDPVKCVYVLYAFGIANISRSQEKDNCLECAIHYFERAIELVNSIQDEEFQDGQAQIMKATIGMTVAASYAEQGRDIEKAISTHRWFLANSNRDKVDAEYLGILSCNFNISKKGVYTIEVLEEFMDMFETFKEGDQLELLVHLIEAYIDYNELVKAKTVIGTICLKIADYAIFYYSGRVELGMCNFEAAIDHFRKAYNYGLSSQRVCMDIGDRISIAAALLGTTLLKQSKDNEAEAFSILQTGLNHCEQPSIREMILVHMSAEYRKLKKWNPSIEALCQVCPSQANKAMAQTYLEQYCTDAMLSNCQRSDILKLAIDYNQKVDKCSTEMHLTQAQLFYFNGDKLQAYHHLELYLDARLVDCKLSCYTCKQRVRPGSIPLSCARCKVALYCAKNHQDLTWENERICHKVLCPLLRYWRKAKRRKEGIILNRKEWESKKLVFQTFFESICPCAKTIIPSPYYDGLTFVD